MSSDHKLDRTGLSQLEHNLLIALRTNDVNFISKTHAQLSQFELQLEQDVSTNSLSQDEAKALFYLSQNVCIASSLAEQAHLASDRLCAQFTKFNLLAQPEPNPSFPPPQPSKQPVVRDDNSSSLSHTMLKKWSQTRIAYLFPSQMDLRQLASETSMAESQIAAWFRNARSRSGWSKLYALKGQVDKDQEKFQLLIEEYESLKRLKSPEEFKKIVAQQEAFQLLDKILRWFATKKESTPAPTAAVRPWIKDVLSSTLNSFKQGAAGVFDSTKQLLPSFSPRSSPASSSMASSSSGPSTAPSSVSSSRSERSDSLDASSSQSTASNSSSSPLISPFNLPSLAASFPPSASDNGSSDSLASSFPNSTPSSSSPSSIISPSSFPAASLFFSNPCKDRPADSQNASSSQQQAPSTCLLGPDLFPLNFSLSPPLFTQSTVNDRFADSLDTPSHSSGSSVLLSPILSPSNLPTAATTLSCSKSSEPDCWSSSLPPFLSPTSQPPELATPFAVSASLPLFVSALNKRPLTILSSSPSESVPDHSSVYSPFSDATQSMLSGQFDDAPEDE
ncbi:uncharacterized protein VP01_32g25 [Puccinia sorghi]|uniref:Homeobox domain-containing protein n=1 Tax=Puccinia sorghi TaxID=27349 RepID=A0A0L6UXL5_9BASI|nr:uncharacterized protein VP01_32g25 [Puccinia sorghi]